ncbi:MAG: LysR family transcriptional regulator [Myxococcales bacterium]|nr:LysR family transcriptional regulator [Myxococcales bacterium]
MENTDLNEISTFVRVVESGGFSAAADELSLPKSTISRRVARLEERLGVRLLERTTRRMRLTEAGQAYFDQVVGPIASILRASMAAEEQQDVPRGLLRITAPVDIGTAILGDLLVAFCRLYPEVDAHVELTGRVVDLVGEGFDVAFRAGELQDSSLVARKLGTTEMGVFASPAYAEAHRAVAHPRDLRSHPFVGHASMTPQGRVHLEGPDGEVADVEVRAVISGNDFIFVRRALIAGGGFGLLPRTSAQESVARGELVRILPAWSKRGGGLHLVHPSARFMPAKTRAFLDFVIERRDSLGIG